MKDQGLRLVAVATRKPRLASSDVLQLKHEERPMNSTFSLRLLAVLLLTVFLNSTNAQTNFTILNSFTSVPDGVASFSTLAADAHWTLYGATLTGGVSNNGTIFAINLDGTGYRVLHSFVSATDGSGPDGAITLASDGKLYGTALAGSISNAGVVFSLNKDGSDFTVLHPFTTGADSGYPNGGLLEGQDGALYGTASSLASSSSHGSVFKINKDGNGYSILHSFTGADGQKPQCKLIQDSDGNLYGTTTSGGTQGAGTIFKMDVQGNNFTNLHNFIATSGDGVSPQKGLIEASDHQLYGTAYQGGGTGFKGIVFKINKDGSGYQMIYSFPTTGTGLVRPNSELIEGTDGALYGATDFSQGAPFNGGIFKLNKDGNAFVALRIFGSNGDGSLPSSGLLQSTNGVIYGTTEHGGANGAGCIFALSASPLPPRILSLFPSTSSNLLQFAGTAAIQYDVERSTNLSSWATLTTLTSPSSCQTNYSDLTPPLSSAFYRIHQH